jgi:hypothetical protein
MNSNRKIATELVCKYLGHTISKNQLLRDFPDSSNDARLKVLLREVRKFLNNFVHREENLSQLLFLVQDIESPMLRSSYMFKLIQQLRFFNEDLKYEIENIGIKLTEAAKSCEMTTADMYPYAKFLLQNGYLELISEDPLLFRATIKLVVVRTEQDVDQMLNNAA